MKKSKSCIPEQIAINLNTDRMNFIHLSFGDRFISIYSHYQVKLLICPAI